jgi:RIO kinase 1
MKIPKRIQPLIEDGLVDEVLSQLMSGKEAKVYLVRCGSEVRCAKVYKEANKRSFKNAAQYQEGRKVRNSRRANAIRKGSKFGRHEQEDIWQNTEVDALYKLERIDVRAPKPYGCFDGVLLMELITDEDGYVAPRLNDVALSAEQALEHHAIMMQYVVRMLCAGMIHGDLSEFNVLVDESGPIIIDLPQVVDAAANNNAPAMLERDVNNITNYYGQFASELLGTQHAREMWALYKSSSLHPETSLTGQFAESSEEANVGEVMQVIEAAYDEEQERLTRLQLQEAS